MTHWRSPLTVAGAASFFVGVMMLPFWYIYLFMATPNGVSVWAAALAQLHYSFSSPERWRFALLLALPIGCVLVGIGFMAGMAERRTGAVTLALGSCFAAIGMLVLGEWVFAALLAWVTFVGARSTFMPNPSFKRTPDGAA